MKKKRHSLFLGITTRFVLLLAAGLLVVSYLSSYFNPATAWFMTLFGLLYIPLLLLNALLLVWSLVRGSRAFVIPLLALIPSLFLVGKYYQFDTPDPPQERGVRIISYNVGRFAMSPDGLSVQAATDSVTRFLRAQEADIICLQEVSAETAAELRPFLAASFPGYDIEYYVYQGKSSCYGNVTLSRFPALDKGKIVFGQSANLALFSDYDIKGTRLRIYNCHFQSYNISLSGIFKSLKGDYREAWHSAEQKMKNSLTLRPSQVDQVMTHIEDCPVAAFVVGDFNDNPMSYTYRRLIHGRHDTFVEAGQGFGATYAGLRPFLRIDYILCPKHLQVLSHTVARKGFSDHYPIISDIKL